MNYRSPIIVLGCRRSGVSILAGALHQCGAFLGGHRLADPRQDRFGNPDVDAMATDYLRRAFCPADERFLATADLHELGWRGRVESTFEGLGLSPDQPWVVRSRAVALMWREWNRAWPDAKWIFVRRTPEDIAMSCLRTGYMTMFSDYGAWLAWAKEWRNLLDQIENGVDGDSLSVWPGVWLAGDLQALRETMEWAGLAWNLQAVTELMNLRQEELA